MTTPSASVTVTEPQSLSKSRFMAGFQCPKLPVTRAEVMHLNGDYRHPGSGPLFMRTDVTAEIGPLLPGIPAQIAGQLTVLRGELPAHAVGAHCWFYGECAFMKRCWPDDADHISNLWNVGPKRTCEWMAQGVHTMSTIPASARLNVKQQRQIRAQREGKLIVERTLAESLRPVAEAKRLGFLDFETVARALPQWNGLGPWRQTAAQFSYHALRVLRNPTVAVIR